MPSQPEEHELDVEAQKNALLHDTDHDNDDLVEKSTAQPASTAPASDGVIPSANGGGSTAFLIWTAVNTLATIGIVFTNKAIFNEPSLKKMQTSFAAFHFVCTTLTLFVISRPMFGFFVPRRAGFLEIAPLSFAMCLNVILPNLSLAYSSVTFYQIARILLTPLVALINYFFYHVTIPRNAALALLPVCCGVGIVSYYDTQVDPSKVAQVTTSAGVIFAFSGVLASSLYTVWIGTYHRKLNMSSMQLLFNQAPVSSFLLLYFIPFCDTFPTWSLVPTNKYVLILLSGGFASLINLSQFFIVAGAGAVSSTVVGHMKTCSIVILGWMMSGRAITDKSLLGILMAVGGIISYSVAVLKARKPT